VIVEKIVMVDRIKEIERIIEVVVEVIKEVPREVDRVVEIPVIH
jgi:hypothetical protein